MVVGCWFFVGDLCLVGMCGEFVIEGDELLLFEWYFVFGVNCGDWVFWFVECVVDVFIGVDDEEVGVFVEVVYGIDFYVVGVFVVDVFF